MKTNVAKLLNQTVRQSQVRERLKRLLQREIPDFSFDTHPVLYLHPSRRESDRPAWSVGAIRNTTGKFYDVYSQDRITDCVQYGVTVHYEHGDNSICVYAKLPWLNQEI